MHVKFSAQSDIGKIRKINEDSYGIDKTKRCFFVCDGMGGHAAGDFASNTAVKTILDYLEMPFNKRKLTLPTCITSILPYHLRLISEAIRLTNRRLFNFAGIYPKLRGMGTTIASIFLGDAKCYIVHVGDSRVYRIRKNEITMLTRDHSWLNEMIEDKEISAKDAQAFVHKNVITRALGTRPTVKIDVKAEDLEEGDIFLLCTDGLSSAIDDNTISNIVYGNRRNLKTAAKRLIDAANSEGGPDNITVILCSVYKVGSHRKSLDSSLEDGKVLTIPEEDEEATRIEDTSIKEIYKKDILPAHIATKEIRLLDNQYFLTGIVAFLILFILGTTYYIKTMHKKRLVKASNINGIKTAPGRLRIFTDPAGAEVYAEDGSMLGETPVTINFEKLNPDVQNLKRFNIKKVGYRNKECSTELIANDLVTIKEILIPEARLELILDLEAELPEDAQIWLTDKNNNRKKLTSINKLTLITHTTDIPKGRHLISVEKAGRVFWKANINVPLDKKAKVYVGKKTGRNITSYENL